MRNCRLNFIGHACVWPATVKFSVPKPSAGMAKVDWGASLVSRSWHDAAQKFLHFLFIDACREKVIGAMKTRDFKTLLGMMTAVSFLEPHKHGEALPMPRAILQGLQNRQPVLAVTYL